MKKFSLFLSLFCLLVVASGVSYADSKRIQNPNNGHWYQRFDNSMPWHDAKAFCENIGGYLATITSQEEQNFVYNQLVSNSPYWCWLGATDETQEGIWTWVTGEPWNYTNWSADEPNNCSSIEHYLMIFNGAYSGEGLWNDLGSCNNGGCGCGGTGEFYLMSTICEFAHGVPAPLKAHVDLIANGGAFDFVEDGYQGFYLNRSPVFDFSGSDFTIHVWVKIANLCNSDGQCRMPIVDKMNGDADNYGRDGWGLYKFDGDNRFRFCLGGGDQWEGCQFQQDGEHQTVVISQTVPETDVWYSIAGVKRSNLISIYVNGELEGSSSLATFLDTNSAPLRVGVGWWDGWRLNGQIGEVQLFSSALSAPHIRALFERSKARYRR